MSDLRRHVQSSEMSDADGWSAPIEPWLHSVRLFAELALHLYVQKNTEEIAYPHLAVRKMLHAEWGSSDNAFASILRQRGFDPTHLDQIVSAKWQQLLKLPLPSVFAYASDEDVRAKIMDFCASRKSSHLRVTFPRKHHALIVMNDAYCNMSRAQASQHVSHAFSPTAVQ